MEKIELNKILDRTSQENQIKQILLNFDKNKKDLTIKNNIYLYGDSGSGKTTFIMNILKELNYDIIKYDAGDVRNKSIIENITKHNMSDKNIMSMFHKKIKKIAIVMDEIDGMNNGDKGGINSLIKIVRPKKTKKQKLEENTMNPIICIGNYHIDKKIKELMKVCNVIELQKPTETQITKIISLLMPNIENKLINDIIGFIQNDLKKLMSIYDIYNNNTDLLKNNIFNKIFKQKSFNDDTKEITNKLFKNNYSIYEHNQLINDTDRTIIGLLWHENIIDYLDHSHYIPFYLKILDNICFSDYIDRITFQKQIWQFNEMTSLIKTFYNNKLFHEYLLKNSNGLFDQETDNGTAMGHSIHHLDKKYKKNIKEVRFTKVLTKYSTEYNNYIFIQNLCQLLNMDQKDLFYFFFYIKEKFQENEIYNLFENYEISKLDINRIFRFIDKYTNENAIGITDNFPIEDIIEESEIIDDL
jgi:DNA polymerase III delta prime subunit